MKTKFNLSVEFDRNAFKLAVERFTDAGDMVHLERIPSPRTGNQNRYYRACVKILSEYTGFTTDEAHELCLRYFATEYTKETKNGKEHTFKKRTSDMDTAEMSEYITKVRQMGDTIGCYLPTSEEYLTNWRECEK